MERDFRVGERVAFVDDEIKGRVKSVGDGKVVVVSDDGFEYRCAPNEIVSQEQAREGLSEYIRDKDWDYLTHDKYAERRRPTPPTNKNLREAPVRVLDLHIEKLVKSPRGCPRARSWTISCTMPARLSKQPAGKGSSTGWCSYTVWATECSRRSCAV